MLLSGGYKIERLSDSGFSCFAERIYNIIVCGLLVQAFGYIGLRMFFPSIKLGMITVKEYTAMGYVAVSIVVIWMLYNYVIRKISEEAIIVVVATVFMLILALQVMAVVYLRVKPTWDFGDIMQGAGDIAKGKPFGYREYFELYPHNLGVTMLVGFVMRLAGGYFWAPYILNVIAIDISLVVAYLLAKRVFGMRIAAMVMLLCLFTTPLYLYAPIVYTDTLSMPFPVLTLYCWVLAWDAAKKKRTGRYFILFGCIGASAAAGYLLKPVAAIGLAAVIAEVLFTCRAKGEPLENDDSSVRWRWRIPALIISIAVFVAGIQLFRGFVDYTGYSQGIPSEKTFPYTHWLAMGMNKPWSEGGTSYGYGGFSDSDLIELKKVPTYQQKEEVTRQRIKDRLNAFGVRGYGRFLLQKLEWTWTDGTYYVPEKLRREPVQKFKIHDYILVDKTKNTGRGYLILAQVVHSIIMLFIFIGGLFAFMRRIHPLYRVMAVMCLGILIFLLFWETRSRYITFLIPAFTLMAALSMDTAFRWLEEKTKFLTQRRREG